MNKASQTLKNQNIKPGALIAFTGGGTGGHVYPNIALHEALNKIENNFNFIYFGSAEKIENKICQESQIPFCPIPLCGGMPRSWKAIFWGFKFLICFLKTYLSVSKTKPALIFGTGGYVAAPVFMAASMLKIPYIIHNLDAHLGLANQAFVKDAAALTLGMKLIKTNEDKMLPQNGPAVLIGNPVREAFYNNEVNKSEILRKLHFESKRKTLIITGGSQGAQYLNEVVIALSEELIANKWQIIHQLGPKQYDLFSERFPQSPFYRPERFLDNLPELYAIADLAIARSGAMSVAEILASKLPAIFIPLPNAAQNHQFHNAKVVEELGACYLLEQKDLNKASLKQAIDFVTERRLLYRTSINQLNQEKPTAKLVEIILALLNKRTE